MIFISYRRSESDDLAGRIYNRLIEEFGPEWVFRDRNTISPGEDFQLVTREKIESSRVFLALIGPNWLGKGPAGRRIDAPNDFVRRETAAALAIEPRILVIPLLVNGASMPRKDELPEELQELSDRNAVTVHPDPDFAGVMDRLVQEVRSWLVQPVIVGSSFRRVVGCVSALLLVVLLIGWWMSSDPAPASSGPKTRTRIEATSFRPGLVVLPPGKFMMGSPEDERGREDNESLHSVEFTRRFDLSQTEVTRGQYRAVMGTLPRAEGCEFAPEKGAGDDLPVVCLTWLESVRYCNRLSAHEGLSAAYEIQGKMVDLVPDASGYRLPTEAEWEYAARAGSSTPWVGTKVEKEVCQYANVADASAQRENTSWKTFSCNDGSPTLSSVQDRRPNRWELYGMGGNAAEWAWDTYAAYPDGPVVDPRVSSQGAIRVVRGGSWFFGPTLSRVAVRIRWPDVERHGAVGLRIARTPR